MEEKNLRDLQKEEALKRMKMLGLSTNVIDEFKRFNVLYYSERQNKIFDGILYFIRYEKQYLDAIKEFEKEHDGLVYHAQLTHTEFGDLLSLLYVSRNTEEWEDDREDLRQDLTFAYVINIDEPAFSEFGTIGIVAKNGGVSRTA